MIVLQHAGQLEKILKMITTYSILHISDEEEKGQRMLRTASTTIQTKWRTLSWCNMQTILD